MHNTKSQSYSICQGAENEMVRSCRENVRRRRLIGSLRPKISWMEAVGRNIYTKCKGLDNGGSRWKLIQKYCK